MVFDLMVMMCKSDQVLGKRQQIHLCDCLTDITGRHVQKPLNPTRQLCSAIQQVAMDRHKEACFATKTRVIFPLGSCAFQQSLFYRGRKRFALADMILRQIIIEEHFRSFLNYLAISQGRSTLLSHGIIGHVKSADRTITIIKT